MLFELCKECRNFFTKGKIFSRFTIKNGVISSSSPLISKDLIKDGQYFRIVGSTFNDGVYRGNGSVVDPLTNSPIDEEFEGAVWVMAVPPSVIALAAEIKAYVDSDAGKASPYVSESFGGYTYTRATGANGQPLTWQKVFEKRLNTYRRLREE
jgi:hypothetical protein